MLHAAAWTGGPDLRHEQAWETNVTATDWLLEAAGSAGVSQFIYFSSVAVYGLNTAPVVDETAATPPVGQLYPDSKIAAEALVHSAQAAGLATTIIRPACTYGPRGGAWTVGPIQQIKNGSLVLLGRDQGWVNTGYIDNLVDGVLLVIERPEALGETFNLCDGQAVTYREFYLRYAAMLGKHRLPTVPAWLAHAAVARRQGPPPPVGPAGRRSLELPFSLQPQPLQHRQSAPSAGLRAARRLRRRHASHRGLAAERRVFGPVNSANGATVNSNSKQ